MSVIWSWTLVIITIQSYYNWVSERITNKGKILRRSEEGEKGRCLPWSKEEERAYIFWMKQVPVACISWSVHTNTWTKQVKQLSKQHQTQWSKCQRYFYVTQCLWRVYHDQCTLTNDVLHITLCVDNIKIYLPSDELDNNIQRTSHFLLLSHWNGYNHFRFCAGFFICIRLW
jgi:hypothetical protein